jgi:hypothetical protein
LARTDATTTIPSWLTSTVNDQAGTPQVGVKSGTQGDAGTYNFKITALVDGSSPAMSDIYNFQILLCGKQAITSPASASITMLTIDLANPGYASKLIPYSLGAPSSPNPAGCEPKITL